MSEHLTAAAPAQPASVPETRAERRQMRRAGISLRARIRTADDNDGGFADVKMTQNASRKAIYFFTKLDRYYEGMRVRVTCPYDPTAGAANLEQIGEIARVHNRGDCYGVAVALMPCKQPTAMQSAGPSTSSQPASAPVATVAATPPKERRCAKRAPFIAPVEMVEMQTGSRIKARTSDLSPQGCYVDTLNPLPVGASVRLQIHREGLVLDMLATVSARHAGSGMGLVFRELAGSQRAVLQSWLSELGLPPSRTIFDSPFPLSSKAPAQEPDCTARLVQVLVRKGLLSQSEAKEVLDEREAERRRVRPLPDAL